MIKFYPVVKVLHLAPFTVFSTFGYVRVFVPSLSLLGKERNERGGEKGRKSKDQTEARAPGSTNFPFCRKTLARHPLSYSQSGNFQSRDSCLLTVCLIRTWTLREHSTVSFFFFFFFFCKIKLFANLSAKREISIRDVKVKETLFIIQQGTRALVHSSP